MNQLRWLTDDFQGSTPIKAPHSPLDSVRAPLLKHGGGMGEGVLFAM
jgi:hypothetical protein